RAADRQRRHFHQQTGSERGPSDSAQHGMDANRSRLPDLNRLAVLLCIPKFDAALVCSNCSARCTRGLLHSCTWPPEPRKSPALVAIPPIWHTIAKIELQTEIPVASEN